MRHLAIISAFCLLALPAQAFDLSFEWGPLKLCTSGKPNTVASPAFRLKNVPDGTKFIRFKLVDRNVRSYNHGGGTVAWKGGAQVPAGAFKYKSPCPPNGAHSYEWTATAMSKNNGGKLGEAKARRNYPE
ncbi:hypothetical protein LX70_00776 [Defluviimonas denitrificans]|jgi:phosphatidylethanolamine-binding protein (PEBP) family uncharacterized protein|uniref:Phospholipid-binding protein n=1 Tax=Albidovulum denitrificans TaxID=404881 RepID=A0A2S8SDS1_9RHOB|nr:phospholipid-binding protein [Defluviimonas denitrificans]PQV58956.1 hypothetical protein LX70_00776 [Defluviimonas denitrificans]